MAYLIIDDGSPESEEYGNNSIYFDEQDPEGLQKALQKYKSLKKGNKRAGCKDYRCRLAATGAKQYCHYC
jgi:hypothetical protein